ncbi:predicted protein [Nematostella vectensis]|uniref:CBS domain-containing protein n=1 Tax=Nematostella vectensis TaxID=45351 RepID=A8DW63_NEMVE|nr:predicted protein [Nematostella vectensis]|eukprot:XP_001617646.1 hypothetical protein NEMVEDRAFT_v1g225916 [Nematostella vectensis]
MHDWRKVVVTPTASIKQVIEVIEAQSLRVALVADENMTLIGTVTDGDVRRGLLKNIALDAPVNEIMNRRPTTADWGTSRRELIEIMERLDILSIPLTKEGKLAGLETLQVAIAKSRYENPVFLMAGGFGTRLAPLTDTCPKPLLKVGDRPLLETLLLSFIKQGFVNFYISLHYKPEMIKAHFGDGSKWNVNITYVYEESPLGTGGALGLLPKSMPKLPIIMMNGDVLTNVNYQRLLEFHENNMAAATMCVREYEYQIPYGVIKGEGSRITAMVEKPVHRFFINAGIYVISQDVVRSVPPNHRIDLPSLLEEKMADRQNVMMFPIHEYWLDIGRMDDFKQAQIDIRSLDI